MPSISFQPVLRDIDDLLKSDFYEIPRFQRPYSWAPEHLYEFLIDVVEENDEGYFIGPMVAYKIERNNFAIVDGQQRITTLTLMLCALRDCFLSVGRDDLANGVEKYIERTDRESVSHFVLRSDSAGSFLATQAQRRDPRVEVAPGNEDQRNIRRALGDIRTWFEADRPAEVPDGGLDDGSPYLEKLRKARDRILSIQVIWIVLDGVDDAYIIFETLNSRGRDLDVVDLLKNYVLTKLPAENGDLDTPGIKWREMREVLEVQGARVNPNSFLLHWWISRYKYVSERKLFRTMKSERLGGLEAGAAVESLLSDSRLYAKIANPGGASWSREMLPVRDSLIALNIFSVRQPRPLLLALLRGYDDKVISLKVLKRTLAAIESYHFITTAVVGASSSGGASMMYAAHAREISAASSKAVAAESIERLLIKLRATVSKRETFLTEFESALYYTEAQPRSKKLVQYALRRFHEHERPRVSLDPLRCNIEHLAPQRLRVPWVGGIGNLIWIHEDINSDLEDRVFGEKLAVLSAHAGEYEISDVLRSATWDEGASRARARRLSELAYDDIWKI